MKGLFFALALAAMAALLWHSATPAQACSVGPDFDPIRDSEIIVAGRMTGWEIIEGATRWTSKEALPENDPNYYGPYQPVRFELAVDRVYKGSAPATLEMVAGNTLAKYGDTFAWVGSSGACGAFDEDPTGKYWILGLTRDDFGRYHPSLFLVFYGGTEPPTSFEGVWISRIKPLLPGRLPVGGGPPGAQGSTPAVLIGAGVLLTALGSGGLAFAVRRSRTQEKSNSGCG